MLRKFKVSNFKGFGENFEFDFTDVNGYEFNKECIKNGLVNAALVYGPNGVGKSNLGLAIMDLVAHLTDKNVDELSYSPYLNAASFTKTASFYYEFQFDEHVLVYTYDKLDVRTTFKEKLWIDGRLVAAIDRNESDLASIHLEGTETLNKLITNKNLSLIKYIKFNSQLVDNTENHVYLKFFTFIENMLFFRSLDKNQYIGLETGNNSIQEDIIQRGNLKDFERFLNRAGIVCQLSTIKQLGRDEIAFDFQGKLLPFIEVASTGTKSLALYYYWFQRLRDDNQVSFVFIDEFDAFYHHSLSALIVEELKRTGVQFVLTTHNTSIITNDLLRPDCYFLMEKERIRSLSKRTSKELREAHNIEKMYKAGSFNG